MKVRLFVVLSMIVLSLTTVFSQKRVIDGNFKITKPINILIFNGQNFPCTPETDKCTIEQIEFEDGTKTIILDASHYMLENTPAMMEEKQKDKNYKPFYYSLSGRNISLVYEKNNDGEGYMIRKNGTDYQIGLVYIKQHNIWGYNFSIRKELNMYSYRLQKGLSLAHAKIYSPGLEFKEKENDLYVYSIMQLAEKKDWDVESGSHYDAVKQESGKLYFNANDELVKWIMYY